MSDNISKISEDFKELAELKIQNSAQFKVITNLTKQNEELKEKVKHLESMMNKAVPTLVPLENNSKIIGMNDPEVDICKMEILKLREKSLIDPLTFEDAKKLETFTKILNTAKSGIKTIEMRVKQLSNADLISSLESHKEES